MHEVLVNRLGGLSLPRKSVVRLTDRPDMTLDVYRGRKTTMQQQPPANYVFLGGGEVYCFDVVHPFFCPQHSKSLNEFLETYEYIDLRK